MFPRTSDSRGLNESSSFSDETTSLTSAGTSDLFWNEAVGALLLPPMPELHAGLICSVPMSDSGLGCCGSISQMPVWYMVRLAWVRTLLRHGEAMRSLPDTTNIQVDLLETDVSK